MTICSDYYFTVTKFVVTYGCIHHSIEKVHTDARMEWSMSE